MRTGLRISSLLPSGLAVESVSDSSDSVILTVRSAAVTARCPLCGSVSRRIHSRYTRQVADLPCAGRAVRLLVISRRFACEVRHCRRQIFAERFGSSLPVRARRTARLGCVVHHLGLALGGRPAASFARRLMLPVSNDTLLRVVRRRTCPPTEPMIVAGIDDWAFRKNHRYGTIVCDLERRRIVALLPDRESARDLVADAFAVAWQRRSRIPPDRPLPWLYRVAGNLLVNRRRRSARGADATLRLAWATADQHAAGHPGDVGLVVLVAWHQHRAVQALVPARSRVRRMVGRRHGARCPYRDRYIGGPRVLAGQLPDLQRRDIIGVHGTETVRGSFPGPFWGHCGTGAVRVNGRDVPGW